MHREPSIHLRSPAPESDTAANVGDLVLVRATLRGDREAIELFVERLLCVPRYLNARNRRWGRPLDEHELCDLVQDVMELLWRKRTDFRGLGSLEGWACGTALLQFCNRVRRAWRSSRSVDVEGVAEPEESAPDVALSIVVREALQELPERERSVVHAKHFEDMSFTEIGVSLDMSPSTAKSCYYRALGALRRVLPRPVGERER